MTTKEAVGVTVSVLPQGWHNIKPTPGGFTGFMRAGFLGVYVGVLNLKNFH